MPINIFQKPFYLVQNKSLVSFTAPSEGRYQAVLYQMIGTAMENPINLNFPLISDTINLEGGFQIDSLLSQHSRFAANLLPVSNELFWKVENLILPIQIEITQVNGTEKNRSEIFYVYNGRIPQESFVVQGHDFLSHKMDPFLNTAPTQKSISKFSQEFLYFKAPEAADLLTVTVLISYRDGSNQEVVFLSLNNVKKHDVFGLNVGFEAVETFANFSKQIDSYKVIARINQKTFIRTYNLEKQSPDQEESLVFLNCFGVYDTIRLKGQITHTNEVNALNFETDSGLVDYLIENFDKISFRSGILEPSWMKYYKENLLNSKSVFWKKNKDLIPLNSLNKSITIQDPNKALDSLQLEYRISYTER